MLVFGKFGKFGKSTNAYNSITFTIWFVLHE